MTTPRDRLFDLCEALVNERLTDAEHAELAALLQDNPVAQRRYLAHLDLHLGLEKLNPREELDEADPVADLARAVERSSALPGASRAAIRPASSRWPIHPAMLSALAAGLLLAAVGVYSLVATPEPVKRPPGRGLASLGVPPRLVQRAGAKFFGEPGPALGAALDFSHPYALAEGQVQIEYANHALVILEAPAAFEIPSAERLTMRVGDCSVTVPHGARGFRVETPLADVVDLGTRFAVQVAENGQTDVQVVEGLAEIHPPQPADAKPEVKGSKPDSKPAAKLKAGEAVRCEDDGAWSAKPQVYDAARFRSKLPDRVMRYQAGADPTGGVDELQSVTVQRGGETHTYSVEDLIGIDVVHFKAGANASNLTSPDRIRRPQVPPAGAALRREVLDRDRQLTTGLLNPGGAREPLLVDPVMNEPEGKPLNTPGLGVRFLRPVVNGPGPDVVLFDLHIVVHPERGDAFHVSPLHFAPGLKTHTVRQYDIDLTSPEAQALAKFRLYRFDVPPTSLGELERGRHDAGTFQSAGAKVLAVGIDLSDLGYPPGASVEGLFFQDLLDDSNYLDPVFIAGFPPVAK